MNSQSPASRPTGPTHDTTELPTTPSPDTGPSAPTSTATAPPPRRRRWSEIVATAAIAALVGSGATLAVTNATDAGASNLTPAPSSNLSGPAAGDSGAAGVVSEVDWSKVAVAASPSVVAIAVQSAQGGDQGSGVVWDSAGNIVTNNHVVASAGKGGTVQVRLGAQTTYEAKVVGVDPTTDLAVVRLVNPPKDLRPIGREKARTLSVGDPVMALGNPLGLSGTVTTGIVSALDRPVTTQAVTSDQQSGPLQSPAAQDSQVVVTNAIQTSAAINPGNSGGALVDATGKLVGINSSIASLSSGSNSGQAGSIGIGFAIPIGEVATVADQLISNGSAQHASLGVSVGDAQVTQGAATISGAGIRQVVAGSPAAAAGLQAGDLVTAVDGRAIDAADGLVGAVRGSAVGSTITLTVINQSGQSREAKATLTAKS